MNKQEKIVNNTHMEEEMKKILIVVFSLLIIVSGIFIGIKKYNIGFDNFDDNINESEEILDLSSTITDECTEDWDSLNDEQKREIIETNSDDEKISPNCILTIQKYYKKCNHIVKKYEDISEELVNRGIKEIKDKYPEYDIIKYSSNDIVLYRELEDECGEHFLIKESDGKICIYKIDLNGNECLYEKTEIGTEYLTETDKIEIEKGIYVYSLEELNQLIENYE